MTQLPLKTSPNQLSNGGFTTSQAAQKLNLHPKTLRRWEQAGKFTPQRTLGNQRRYSSKDIIQLQAIKIGQITPQLTDKLLTTNQAAQKLHVSPATIRRWTRENKLKLTLDKQLNQGYSNQALNQFLKTPTTLVTPEKSPSPPPSPASDISSLPQTISWLKRPKLQKAFVYSSITTLFLSLGLVIYLYLNHLQSPVSPSSDQILGAQDIEVILPKVGSFLNNRITIGSDTGDLSFLDDKGNLYAKNVALIENSLHTSSLQLLPSSQPENQIGRQYVNQDTGDLMYFDGSDWISLNQNVSSTPSLQDIYDIGDTTLIAENQDIDITLGNSATTSSATSLRFTLAGSLSSFKILGGASQELISFDDDSIYPVSISQPTQITANLYANQLIDTANVNYYLDPANTDLSLSVAGDATISATLKFSSNNQYLTGSTDNFIISSAGLAVGNKTNHYFDSDGNIKAKQLNLSSDLNIGGLKISNNLIQNTNQSEGLFLADNGNLGIGTSIPTALLEVSGGDIKITNGSFIDDGTSLTVPDYVFEDDYQPLSPIALEEFITLYHHLPGVPSQTQISQHGLNLSSFILNLLERLEINTLYILDLYEKQAKIITPTTETEILTTNFISPLTDGQITIAANLTIAGHLQAPTASIAGRLQVDELIANKIKASTIEGLRDKITNLVDQYQQDTTIVNQSDPPSASVSALIANLQTPPASPAANLELNHLNAKAGFFSEYLAVLGSATITNLKISNSLTINNQLLLSSNSISTLSDTLYLQPTGQGAINFLAGLMTLDQTGQVTINGDLKVTGAIIASQINTPENTPLQINIANQSAISIYNPIGQVASIDASGSASFNSLSLNASGTATISAGTNHIDITVPQLTPRSQVILTFNSNYAPATKYWVVKEPDNHQFNVFVNYPVNQPATLDWLIIN